jgi:hypothetical protein
MSTNPFGSVPDRLTGEQRTKWIHRQQTAIYALDTQALAGTVANAETVAAFKRYVQGETGLTEAIAKARAQLAEEHIAFRQYHNRRTL